jgi:Domain of unknown function (DUF1887)
MILISLLGEQPIPNLLPALHLKPDQTILVYTRRTEAVAHRLVRILPNAHPEDLQASPYEIEKVIQRLETLLVAGQDTCFNLTGGTKTMALAAYQVAARCGCPFVYLESEGKHSLLYQYSLKNGIPTLTDKHEIGELITIKDYLLAHMDGYQAEGFHREETGELSTGGLFEQAGCQALQLAGLEVLSGVRPAAVGRQLEIDLVVRLANQVGLVEFKLGDKKGETLKRGLDQLTNVGGREYLGTYTARFLVAGRQARSEIKALAAARTIAIIELPNYQTGHPLSPQDAHNLVSAIRARLAP